MPPFLVIKISSVKGKSKGDEKISTEQYIKKIRVPQLKLKAMKKYQHNNILKRLNHIWVIY